MRDYYTPLPGTWDAESRNFSRDAYRYNVLLGHLKSFRKMDNGVGQEIATEGAEMMNLASYPKHTWATLQPGGDRGCLKIAVDEAGTLSDLPTTSPLEFGWWPGEHPKTIARTWDLAPSRITSQGEINEVQGVSV